MTKPTASNKAVKASPSKVSVAIRRKTFAERYLVNGNNASEAAKFAGYSEATAAAAGHRLLNHPQVKGLLGDRVEAVLRGAQLSTERWAKEMVCLGHFDPGELYDAAGNLIPIHQLPEHVRRAIASVETVTDKDGETTKKVKFWDKNAALANIGKHLGMFERDNMQKAEPIHVTITLVGKRNGPASRADIAGEARVLDESAFVQGGVRR